jgi:hypothetical protein
MPVSASIAVQSSRAEQRLLSHNPVVARLWRAMQDEWQRRAQRAVARSVYRLDHPGVAEDYRTAARLR